MISPSTQRFNGPVLISVCLGFVLLVNAGCGGPIGSRLYRPVSVAEEMELAAASRTVYPADVRANPASAANSSIAWAGIITEIAIADYGEFLETTLILEHHYFLWVESWGSSPVPFLLSPRGEGTFETTWRMTPDSWQRRLDRFTGKGIGNLVLVYGKPLIVDDNRIVVEATHIREIDSTQYTTDYADFGREGEPLKRIGD